MKDIVERLIVAAAARLQSDWGFEGDRLDAGVERAKLRSHGDFASNIALTLAKITRRKPREIAAALCERLDADPLVARVEIAGAGFLNFFLAPHAYHALVAQILAQGEQFGRRNIGAGQRIQVEFVSANPTGPLHVGHGRGAAYGAAVATLLSAVGFQVEREYYVNDAGRQMDILATSIWLRYLELCGGELRFPSNGYRGDYVWDIAATLHRNYGTALQRDNTALFADLPADAPLPEEIADPTSGDKEAHIDGLITRAKYLLQDDYRTVFNLGLETILADIRDDLAHFGVEYQNWYSERSLATRGKVAAIISRLQDAGHLYQHEGAIWFRATTFGDEKDRVVVRENGQTTYFATDIAYHIEKYERGFERIINIWGADHHGYVPRLKAALSALGVDPKKLAVLLVQFALLYRNGARVQMSTRSGEFVTLRELRKEVGRDAARFFYVQRAAEQHLDFDLDLAKAQSNDNPVYYCQYAHARIRSVFRALPEKGLNWEENFGVTQLHLLTADHEQILLITLSRYPEVIENAALNYAPHLLANYLRDLAADFHTYYNAHAFLVADANLRAARLTLIAATRQILANGLQLLGVSAPDEM